MMDFYAYSDLGFRKSYPLFLKNVYLNKDFHNFGNFIQITKTHILVKKL